MRTKLRSRITLLFMTCALLIAVPAVAAIADVVQNDIDTSIDATAESRTVSTDGSTVVGYTLRTANNNDDYPDSNGCNTQGGNTVNVSIDTPTGVTASPSSLAFTSCDVTQNVTFTATKATAAGSPHVITVSASGGVSGSKTYTAPATWELIVNKGQPSFSAVSGTGNAGASNGSLTATLKNTAVTPNKNVSGKDVTFKIDNNTVPGTAQTNANGVATLSNVNLSNISEGTKNLTAHFAGDADYLAANGSGNLVVGAPLCTPTSSVTTQPEDRTVTYGANSVSFTAAANGSPAPGVQWQVNTGSGFSNISGATNGTLTINNPSVSQSGNQYRAVFTNTCNGTNSVQSNAATLTVNKATATVQLNNLTHTYDGTAKSASATTSNPSGLNVNIAYSQNGNPVANPTNAGSYAVVATVDDANYQGSASGTLTINKAAGSVSITNIPNNAVFGGSFTPNVSAAGEGQTSLSTLTEAKCTVTNAGVVNFVGAGTCTLRASVDEGTNHLKASSEESFEIAKANAVINVNGFTGTYDGNPKGASGTATGADGSNLSSLLNLGATFTNFPGGTANWSFAGDANHNAASGSVQITINKADADIRVDGYTGTYDGQAHGASGTATGVGGSDLSNLLDLGASFTNVPGGTANWSFAGNTNYKAASGSVAIVINKATATVQLSNLGPFVYDGTAKAVQVSTTPSGLNVEVKYNGLLAAPTLSGSYPVVATVNEQNYRGSATGTLTINPYPFTGFFQPLDNNGTLNSAKAGSTIPVKFSLGGDRGMNIFLDNKLPTAGKIACDPSAVVDPLEEVSTATVSGLKYDPVANQYIYNWKTATSYAGTCQQLVVRLADGSVAKTANFKFTK